MCQVVEFLCGKAESTTTQAKELALSNQRCQFQIGQSPAFNNQRPSPGKTREKPIHQAIDDVVLIYLLIITEDNDKMR